VSHSFISYIKKHKILFIALVFLLFLSFFVSLLFIKTNTIGHGRSTHVIKTKNGIISENATSGTNQTASGANVAPVLHIQGNHFVDASGKQVVLRGVTVPNFQLGCNADGHYQPSDFQAIQSWGMNAVRITLNSTSWVAGSNGCSAQEYQKEVQTSVTNAESQGFYVMLVLQWETPDSGTNEDNGANINMAYPQDKTFWKQVVAAYAADAHIGFVPVTEPHDVSWDQWYNGWNGGPGMKELVQMITTAAPNHIIFVNGINWAKDVTFLTNNYAITGSNIAYEVHIYGDWPRGLTDDLMQKYPIIAGEYGIDTALGGGPDMVAKVMNYFESHKTGYFAWGWTARGDTNVLHLLDSWSGAPRDNQLGKSVHDFILRASQTDTPPNNPHGC
jgi:endoglucanase